jgi:hypothetical protein
MGQFPRIRYNGQLVEKLDALGVQETERNLANKISPWRIYSGVLDPMSRSNWLSFCAAAGIILTNTTGVYGESQNAASNSTRNQHASVPIENFRPASDSGAYPFKLIEQTFGTEITTVQSTEDQKRAERGVEAEKKLADWTPWLFIVGLLEMAITGVGIYLLAKTLGHTKRAADAAVGTLTVITENGQRELRAYITVEPAGLEQLIMSSDVIGQAIIRNVGRIPARNVSVILEIKLSNNLETNFPKLDRNKVERVIQPGATMKQGTENEIATRQITRLTAKYAFVWGTVFYDDGFEKSPTRFTQFCHRYWVESHVREPDLLVLKPCVRVIIPVEQARYHTHGNNAD